MEGGLNYIPFLYFAIEYHTYVWYYSVMLMHIDMDAFFASVEQQINPALKGKPVIVGSRDNKYHTVVAAASYEAKAYGIHSGMPSYEAFKICPHAEFVACESEKYAYVSSEILKLLHEYSPYVKHSTIDEYDLLLDGLEPIFGSFLKLGKTIKDRIKYAFGLTCSIGIAPTWILAKLGTKINKPDGLILINDSNLDGLVSGLPVEHICGIGQAITARLTSLGVTTCGQLKAMPENILVDNFGRHTGHWLWAILRTSESLPGKENPCQEIKEPDHKSIGHSHTLPRETNKQDAILAWLRMLSEMVAERARKNGFTGHTVSLWLSSKNESIIRQKTYRLPTNDGWEIFARARAIFGTKKGHFSTIRAIGITLSGLISNTSSPLLIEQKRREALLKVIDLINARYGDWTMSPAILGQIKRQNTLSLK